MRQVDENHNGQEIRLSPGEILEICLGENRTTGFRWVMESGGVPACILAEDRYEPSALTPGAGGVRRWQFRAAQTGEGRIEMCYRRPWETRGAAGRIFALRIVVAG